MARFKNSNNTGCKEVTNWTETLLTKNAQSYTCSYKINNPVTLKADRSALRDALNSNETLLQLGQDCTHISALAPPPSPPPPPLANQAAALRSAHALQDPPVVTAPEQDKVWIAVVDDNGKPYTQSISHHGDAVLEVVHSQYYGSSNEGGVKIKPFCAMPHASFDEKLLDAAFELKVDAAEHQESCGTYGYVSDLISTLNDVMESFPKNANNRLVINMSLGWESSPCGSTEPYSSLLCATGGVPLSLLKSEAVYDSMFLANNDPKSRFRDLVPELALLEQLYRIQCEENVMVVVAAGNQSQPAGDERHVEPGAWMGMHALSPTQCKCLFEGCGRNDMGRVADSGRPLVYAVTATDDRNKLLANVRSEAISRFAAVGRYAYQGVDDPGSTRGFFSGSSIAAGVVSGRVANYWSKHPDLDPASAIKGLYSHGGTNVVDVFSTLQSPGESSSQVQALGSYQDFTPLEFNSVKATKQSPLNGPPVSLDSAYLISPQPSNGTCVVCGLRLKEADGANSAMAKLYLNAAKFDQPSMEVKASSLSVSHSCSGSVCNVTVIQFTPALALSTTTVTSWDVATELQSLSYDTIESATIELALEYATPLCDVNGTCTTSAVKVEPIDVRVY